jgi:hypothetical protein
VGLRHYGLDSDEAEEVAQAVFVGGWRALTGAGPPSAPAKRR